MTETFPKGVPRLLSQSVAATATRWTKANKNALEC